MIPRVVFLAIVVVIAALDAGCGQPSDPRGSTGVSSPVFTISHRTAGDAVRDFFGVHPKAVQPIEFPHRTHIQKGLTCTDYCHDSVTKGPVAGIPGVRTCMVCHAAIATDRPLIQQVAGYEQKGIDLPWQRVYGYPNQSHVRFNHAPHIRANVDCSTCHGQIADQTVAQRNVNLTMGFCVNCHRAKNVSNDCLICHY